MPSQSSNHGLIISEPIEGDYVLGGSVHLYGDVLVRDGQWNEYLPTDEFQNLVIEPLACASFGTLNCIETLINREYGSSNNYSDRYLAEISGTTTVGNDPHTVAEILRKKGCVEEKDWPYTPDLDTWAKFYKTPDVGLDTLALEFVAEYEFGHEYVPNDPVSMMEALKYSPLGFSCNLYSQVDGVWVRPVNGRDNHWVCCYGYEENHYWKIFDSYDNSHKRVAWSNVPNICKRYTLNRQVINETAWTQFVKLLRNILGL